MPQPVSLLNAAMPPGKHAALRQVLLCGRLDGGAGGRPAAGVRGSRQRHARQTLSTAVE